MQREINGALRDKNANPVYDLLSRYPEMYEGEII
jgi:hypothetical protein